jgi:hypothetical protein
LAQFSFVGMPDLILLITEGSELVVKTQPRKYGKGVSENTVWKNKPTRRCTSSTLLYCAVGALWMLASNPDVGQVLSEFANLATSVTFLAMTSSKTNTPRLWRFSVGLAQCLWHHPSHRRVMRPDIMEVLFVDMLDSNDPSIQCDGAIGISICAMESQSKITTATLGGISKILRVLEMTEVGSDIQYCMLHALLNLSQDPQNQIEICSKALRLLYDLVETTSGGKDSEIFSLARAIVKNIEKNRANLQAFHKFNLVKNEEDVMAIDKKFQGRPIYPQNHESNHLEFRGDDEKLKYNYFKWYEDLETTIPNRPSTCPPQLWSGGKSKSHKLAPPGVIHSEVQRPQTSGGDMHHSHVLIKGGAEANVTYRISGDTPLHCATTSDRNEQVRNIDDEKCYIPYIVLMTRKVYGFTFL